MESLVESLLQSLVESLVECLVESLVELSSSLLLSGVLCFFLFLTESLCQSIKAFSEEFQTCFCNFPL